MGRTTPSSLSSRISLRIYWGSRTWDGISTSSSLLLFFSTSQTSSLSQPSVVFSSVRLTGVWIPGPGTNGKPPSSAHTSSPVPVSQLLPLRNCRGVSLIHVSIVIPLAARCLDSPTLSADRAFGWDERAGTVFAISAGYFLWDVIDMILHFEGFGFIVHG